MQSCGSGAQWSWAEHSFSSNVPLPHKEVPRDETGERDEWKITALDWSCFTDGKTVPQNIRAVVAEPPKAASLAETQMENVKYFLRDIYLDI